MLARLRAIAYLLPQIAHALVSARQTVRFPFGPVQIPDGYRGKVSVRPELCRGCGLCARDCPSAALELQRDGPGAFRLLYYPDRCAYCGQCEVSCRFGAIAQTSEFVRGTTDPRLLTEILVDRTQGSGGSQDEDRDLGKAPPRTDG
jgi:formate hydrogenlyase subunit 6/NADH:ubiquinone oxidoreductase subunit I